MSGSGLLVIALLAPWVFLALIPWMPHGRHWSLALTPVPALVLALLPDGSPLLSVAMGAVELRIGMDETARGFLLPAAVLWLLAGWFAGSPGVVAERRAAFSALWLAAFGGNLLLVLAQDLLSFYTGLALMSFAAWGLVIHERGREAMTAGWLYLAMVMLAELALFTAVAWGALIAETGAPIAFGAADGQAPPLMLALLALGFGIKLGAFGLHSWLPRAHPVAPVPASAVLSGVMIKAGVLGCWRMLEGASSATEAAASAVLVLGFVGALYGVLMGLRSDSPKAMLGWSSVSQMGLATMILGLAASSGNPAAAWPALLILVGHHGLSKGALFLGAGLVPQLSGVWRRRAWAALWLPALALAAAPFTGGALTKAGMSLATAELAAPGWVIPALAVTSVATTMLMWRFLWAVRAAPREAGGVQGTVLLPYFIAVALALLLPWWSAANPELIGYATTASVVVDGLWPLLLGVLLAAATAFGPLGGPGVRPRFRLPRVFSEPFHPRHGLQRLRSLRWLVIAERRLHGWPVVGRLMMSLLLPLALLLWW